MILRSYAMLYVAIYLPWCEKHNKMIFLRHFNRKCITCILDSMNVTIVCYTNNNTAYKTQPNRPHFTAASRPVYTNNTMTSHFFLQGLTGTNITYNTSACTRRSFLLTLAVISAIHHGSPTYSYSIWYDRTISVVLVLQTQLRIRTLNHGSVLGVGFCTI